VPLYEYECRTCETRFERLTTLAGADAHACPSCGDADVRRLLSVIAGGTGFAQAPAPTCGGGACGNC
jgi:putative FmdB family regulatory protein